MLGALRPLHRTRPRRPLSPKISAPPPAARPIANCIGSRRGILYYLSLSTHRLWRVRPWHCAWPRSRQTNTVERGPVSSAGFTWLFPARQQSPAARQGPVRDPRRPPRPRQSCLTMGFLAQKPRLANNLESHQNLRPINTNSSTQSLPLSIASPRNLLPPQQFPSGYELPPNMQYFCYGVPLSIQ